MEKLWHLAWDDARGGPVNGTMHGMADNQAQLHERLSEICYIPLFSIAITLLRRLYNRFIAVPICLIFNLSDGSDRKPPQSNLKLEEAFKKKKRLSADEAIKLSKQLDLPIFAIRTWFRRKRNWNKPSLQKKFCEASWRFLFYTFLFSYGMWTLWQSSWFWDTQLCWENFGHQEMHWPEFGYYMLESSFYLSLLFSVMTDIKRKDFTEQLIHHVATLFLIIFSYLMTFVRIGTLVMAVHDISDVFLELAKCFHYVKKAALAETLFVLFAVIFVISRLVVYPFWVIHTSAVKSLTACHLGIVWYFFNGLLTVLLCLHIFWASIIFKMAKDMIIKGKVEKDDRSDTEEELSEDEACVNGNHK